MEDVEITTQVLTIPDYAKQTDSTYRKVRTLCEAGILPAYKTDGGQWRILVNNNYVSREIYERALMEISRLSAKLKSIEAILKNT